MPKDYLTEARPNLQRLPPDRLYTDGGTQPRGRLDHDVVERYAEAMLAELWDFSKSSAPITAFHDGEIYWLADGFHRVAAAKKTELAEVEVEVRQGGKRDAIVYSVGANATHGYPRSNDDKRRAVSRLLDDPEWSKWSDREIARRCSVTHPFVSKLRASLETVTGEQTRTYTNKHGTVATMDTSAIGKTPVQPASRDAPNAEWSLPEKVHGGVRAAAKLRGVTPPDAGATRVVTEPVGELRVDLSLPGRQVADAEREKALFMEAISPLSMG